MCKCFVLISKLVNITIKTLNFVLFCGSISLTEELQMNRPAIFVTLLGKFKVYIKHRNIVKLGSDSYPALQISKQKPLPKWLCLMVNLIII